MTTVPTIRCPYCGMAPAHEAPADLGPETYVCKGGCNGIFDEYALRERWWE